MNDAELERYLEVGYHVAEGLWSPAECRELIDAGHRLPGFAEGSRRSVMHPHRLDPLFLRALGDERIVRIMRKLVGGAVSGLQTQFFYGAPGTVGFNAHQDNYYVRAGASVFASAWTALEDIGPENGGLYVYPGSQREDVLPVRDTTVPEGAPLHDPNSNRFETVVPARYSRLDLAVKAGAVVFIHGNVIHGSNTNRTRDRHRHALLSTYVKSGEAFRPGAYSQREEIRFG